MVGIALGSGRLAAQAPAPPASPAPPAQFAPPDQAQPLELPSKGAPPPRTRIASRQSISGDGPLPPGLMNKTPRLEDLPSTQTKSSGPVGLTGKETVVKVIIDPPLKHVKEQDARRHIKTKADRPYDPRTVEEDVRQLTKSKMFAAVDPEYQRVGDNGIIVIYHVIERPQIKYLRFFGNEKIKERHLRKQSGLKVGDPWDPYIVEDARNKVEEYYREKGFNKIKIVIIEGNRKEDRGVVYLVNEGQKQRISKVEFVGNNVASDGRLKTQIQTKPPLLYLFKGEVDRAKIEEDIGRLYEYYRNLGYFRAKISRELVFNEDQNWLTVRFVVDEGPRYKVRNVGFVGQKIFTAEALGEKLKLKAGDYYDRMKLDKDVLTVTDKYGVKGYVFAVVQPEQSFQGDPSELDQIDIVYQIEEGRPCIVSRVDVKISGDNPHTRRNTILNRVALHPGDILSTRDLRDSERRLKASQLFKTSPGDEPRITFDRPKLDDEDGLAEKPPRGAFRGQSPDRRGAP